MNINKFRLGKMKTILSCMLVISLISSCCSIETDNPEHYVKLVKTSEVKEISSLEQKSFTGVIEEAQEVNLSFRVAGPVVKLHIKEGQFVKKGQLIAEMDTRDYEIQKNAIEAQVKQLRSEYKRIEELKNRKSVADNDYEKMKAGKEMAEVKLKNAVDQLNDTRLYAPCSGYITKVMIENGQLVNHGTPIASLIDISMLKLEINVPVSMYINRDAITEIEFTQADIPGRVFPLVLFGNNVKANNNGLYKFYLYHKPAPDSKLVPGMNVSVNIKYASKDSSLLSIPVKAVFEKDNHSYVWVVENSKVQIREIYSNNLVKDGDIGISNGLKAGEKVVIGGLNLLSEDEKVKVIESASKTNVGNIL